jgi:hypothetical protein
MDRRTRRCRRLRRPAPRGSRRGATNEELVCPMPADHLLVDPKTRTMHAVTIGRAIG